MPPHLAHLPPPPPEAQALSDELCARIESEISASGGRISFARYMELALYAPALGYYSAGSRKLGASGDFVTAPEISPLFARCLARQLGQLLDCGLSSVMELGAGSGALAAELLLELERRGYAPDRYLILELSADLQERQWTCIAERAPHHLARVSWINTLPGQFEGVILANEVLDATPAHVVSARDGEILEAYVQYNKEQESFLWYETAASEEVREITGNLDIPHNNYHTEIHLTARALVASLMRVITRGVALFIDYGFPAHEYYHPQRNTGTLMCHYRHHAHDDPFCLVGLQDITAHVNFSAIAATALSTDAQMLGYTSQANFLINSGITDLLAMTPAEDVRAYAPLAAQVQKLTSPAEMGELFKAIALGKGIEVPLIGFARGDRSHTL